MNALVLLFIATVWLRKFPLYQALLQMYIATIVITIFV